MSYVNFSRAKENGNAIHRVRRAGPSNKLTLFSDHMQVLARVANAVALQIKMAESTEPSDDAIGELLKMGLMTPEQLVTADWQPTKTAIGDLKKLPTQLKTSTDITKTEDRLEVLEKMRSSQVDVTKIKDLPGKKEFEDTANGVKGSIDKNKITEVFKAVGNLKGELTTIAETGDEDAAKQDDVVNILFVTKWEKVEKTCKDAVSVLDNIKKIASLGDKSAFFQLLVEERKVGEQYVLFQFDNDFLNDIIANSDLLQNTGTTFASNADSLKLLRSFIEARQSKRNSAVATNGFVNGLDDFDRLDGDTVNDWLSNAGKLDADTRRGILKALESLKEFKTRTNTVETDWAPLNGLTTSTKTVVDEQLLIVDHTTSVKTTVQEFQSCDHTKSPVKDIAITAAFRATVNKLKAAAPTLALFEEMSKLKDLSAFKNVIAPIDGLAKDEKKKKAWQVVQDLKAIPAFNQTYELVQKLASKTTEMETTLTEAQKDVDAIDIGPVNTYHKSVVDSEILEVYSCLRTKTGGEALFKSIELVRSIRGSPLDTQTDEAGQFVDTLDGSKQTLENLRQWTQNVTATSDEEKALKVLADAQTVSAQLGTAVRGLVAIGEVLGKKPQLDPLLGDLAFVSAAVNVHMSQLSAEELAELQKLDALKTSLTDMFQKIDAYEAVVNGLADSDFKAGAPAFAAANEIPDVVVDIGKMRAALQALKQTSANDQSPPDLDPLIGAIDSLDGLSLDFSSFSFASAPGSLTALDQFFDQFRTSLQSAPASNGNIAGSAPGGNNAGLLNGESTVDSTKTVLLVIVLIMAAIAVICSVLGGLYAFHRHKKNKEEAKKAEEEAKKIAAETAKKDEQNENIK